MGDRHCDNILMYYETGEIFHIDYECVFNKGKGLQVPEIVDFRLTKNFRHGLGTLLEYGVFFF
jgi:cell cycle checkpoint protein MEC1